MFLSKTFSALADGNRQKIMKILKKREMSVSEILSSLDITMPTLSHHLDVLRQTWLISSRRAGREILYSLNLSIMEELAGQVAKFLHVKNKK